MGDDEDLPKTEVAALPVVAGSSDIGVQLGAVGTITRLVKGFRPFRWDADAIISASFKDGPRGFEIVQQSHDFRVDIPHIGGGPYRVSFGAFFERTVNAGYFGLGNGTLAIERPDGTFGSRYQYTHTEARTRLNVRRKIKGHFDIMVGTQLRYIRPSAYVGSQLEADIVRRNPDGTPVIRGLEPIGMAVPGIGIIYDSRDHEIVPTRGAFDLVGFRAGVAVPASADIAYGGFSAVLRRYYNLAGPLVLAGRVITDFMAGHAPFYELAQGGLLIPMDMPGGSQGIRGVPNGRYSGLMKIVANLELRAMVVSFKMLNQRFRIGGVIFGDTGRVWNDYKVDARDGTGIGLKYGAGAGLYFQWGEVAMFRIELAYSPDARSANPSFPFGLYAADGQMF